MKRKYFTFVLKSAIIILLAGIVPNLRKENKMFTNTTLIHSLDDPRFVVTKKGWDKTPRNFLPREIIERPIWNIGFDEDAFDWESNVVGMITNFDGEGPMATVNYEGKKVTVSAPTLDATFELAIAAYFDCVKQWQNEADFEAEFVIEGYVETEFLEPEAPFGESTEKEVWVGWDDLTEKARSDFKIEWIESHASHTGCDGEVASVLFDQWLNTEAQYHINFAEVASNIDRLLEG